MKSLIPDAQRNLENWKALLGRADCAKTDAANLREDVERTMDQAEFLKSRALETICQYVRLGKGSQFYCTNYDNCPYKGNQVRITAAGGNSFDAPVCRKAYDTKRGE
ncbi:MAG: hypothetical protein NTY99_01395 [DPANN group archaeon]|nr:hypothetical protein [DPANN group archaeon]